MKEQTLDEEDVLLEIKTRFEQYQNSKETEFAQYMDNKGHEKPISPLIDDDSILKDFEEFEKLRVELIDEIEGVNVKLKH